MRELFVDVATVVRENGRESDQGEVERCIHRHTGPESDMLSHHPVITAELPATEEIGRGEEGKVSLILMNQTFMHARMSVSHYCMVERRNIFEVLFY